MNRDGLIRGITADGLIKITAVDGLDMVQRAREIHNSMPLATAALGRTLIAASIMGDELKDTNGSVTLQFRGDGPLGAITAVADSGGNVRGYLQNPGAILPLREDGKLDVGRGVGQGLLTVIKDIGAKEPFAGKIELESGEIAQDIAAYYAISEQIPTVCALGVLVDRDYSVKQAGGFILQLLPSAPEGLAHVLEMRLEEMPSVTAWLETGRSMEEMAQELLHGMGLQILERHPVAYECKCSEEKVRRAIRSMGREELESLLREEGKAEITCQFCDRVYQFSQSDLEEILASIP